MSTIKGILIDTTKQTIAKHEIEINSYKDIVSACKCDYVTCATRKINGHKVDIWCDDEALLKSTPLIPAIITTHNDNVCEMIFGNCFICASNSKGETKSLSNNIINNILKSISKTYFRGKFYVCLPATL